MKPFLKWNMHCAEISTTQILRKIDFGNHKAQKSASFENLVDRILIIWNFLTHFRAEIDWKMKIRAFRFAKMAALEVLQPPKIHFT